MLVTEALLLRIAAMYRDYARADAREVYLKHFRPQLRILIDSLWEQILNGLLSVRPRNALEARQAIARGLGTTTLESTEKEVLNALAEVLKNYELLSSGPYMEIGKTLDPLVRTTVFRLSYALVVVPRHAGLIATKKLAQALEEIGPYER